MFAAANVWHFWIAVVLMVTLIVPACVMTVVLYFRKVEQLRYPKANQERG